MTEQGGALAGLRAATQRMAQAEKIVERAVFARGWIEPAETTELSASRTALNAELAAVEARLEKFKRFVRAVDVTKAPAVVTMDRTEFDAAITERLAARAALTDEDMAP